MENAGAETAPFYPNICLSSPDKIKELLLQVNRNLPSKANHSIALLVVSRLCSTSRQMLFASISLT